MTVDAACEFFADEPPIARSLDVLREVGLGYLRLGQPATELSGGEAQRIKLATELQRMQRGNTLYVLDEPTTGLHPADVEQLMRATRRSSRRGQHGRSSSSTTCAWSPPSSDWVIDIGPGAGEEGGRVVGLSGTPEEVASVARSATAPHLRRALRGGEDVARRPTEEARSN